MKLLLTSNGFSNKSIANALKELAGKDFPELNLIFIPTAANIMDENKTYLIDDLYNCKKLGFKQIDIVDIGALPVEIIKKRLEKADVLMFGGGDTFYLRDWIWKTGLRESLPKLLETRVYVGISAGSMVATANLSLSDVKKLYYEHIREKDIDEKALGFVNFLFRPHLNSAYFPNVNVEFLTKQAKETILPIYAADDQTAIKVDGEKVEVISEGEWKRFN
ncbi:MAG TPA: Type 1 glutamine amidotransferase-like domain-containing protein [Candidatus Nanoarchaeia archaeon]